MIKKQLNGGRAYLILQFKWVNSTSWLGKHGSRSMGLDDHISLAHRKLRVRTGSLVRLSILKACPFSSKAPLPKGLIAFPDSATNWGPRPSAQIYEHVEDVIQTTAPSFKRHITVIGNRHQQHVVLSLNAGSDTL